MDCPGKSGARRDHGRRQSRSWRLLTRSVSERKLETAGRARQATYDDPGRRLSPSSGIGRDPRDKGAIGLARSLLDRFTAKESCWSDAGLDAALDDDDRRGRDREPVRLEKL